MLARPWWSGCGRGWSLAPPVLLRCRWACGRLSQAASRPIHLPSVAVATLVPPPVPDLFRGWRAVPGWAPGVGTGGRHVPEAQHQARLGDLLHRGRGPAHHPGRWPRAGTRPTRSPSPRRRRAASAQGARRRTTAPPFRFSGSARRARPLGAAITRKLARAMVVGGGGTGDVPAGYTYLGQFVDHDLTMDRTDVMLGDDVAPVDLLQGRSPRLDLDSLYGNGPGDAGVREVLRGRRAAPQDRDDDRGRRPTRAKAGHDLPRVGHRREQGGQAQGADPRPAQRREPHRRPDPPRDDPLPQPGASTSCPPRCRPPQRFTPRPQAGHACTTSG